MDHNTISDKQELPTHMQQSYPGAIAVLVYDCCGDPVPHHKSNCKNFQFRISDGGSGYSHNPITRIGN